jgi:hypothetical protein
LPLHCRTFNSYTTFASDCRREKSRQQGRQAPN